MAATVPVDKAGDVNPLLEAAKQIGEPADNDENKKEKTPIVAEPVEGSFERFMSSFGSPGRWAGR